MKTADAPVGSLPRFFDFGTAFGKASFDKALAILIMVPSNKYLPKPEKENFIWSSK